MVLEAKGRIKYNPDVKPSDPQYIMECPQLGVISEGHGDINQMMDELTERVRRAIADEFFVSPSSVQIVAYSMGLTFAVEGPVNRTLEEFAREPDDDDTKVTITSPDGKSIETTRKRVALAAEIMKKSNETGIPPEEILAAAKKKTAKEGAK